MQREKIRYGCIGAGMVARVKHLATYIGDSRIDCVGIVDTNLDQAENVAKQFCIPSWYGDVVDFLDSKHPDLVSLCVPNGLHYPLLMACLSRGIGVHCEKPMVVSLEQAKTIADLLQKKNGYLFVGMNKRFATFTTPIKNMLDDGDLGKIDSISILWRRWRGIPGKGGWFTNKEASGGGVLLDLGVHVIDLALFLQNFPSVLSITGSTSSLFLDEEMTSGSWGDRPRTSLPMDVEDNACGFVRLEGGAHFDFTVSWASNIREEEEFRMAIMGKAGSLYFDQSNGLEWCRPQHGKQFVTKLQTAPGVEEFSKQCRSEVDACIRGYMNGRSESPAGEAVSVMSIIDGIYSLN